MAVHTETTWGAEELARCYQYMREARRLLHRRPELSFCEAETQAYIAAELTKRNVPFKKVSTGVIAEIAGESPETVAFRADTDALPIEERTGAEYASTVPGVMHACGHDGHTACLLGLADILSRHTPPRTVRLIFQPAEEGEGGALKMIEGGALEGVSEIYAQHLDPECPAGSIRLAAGPAMAGTVEFDARFTGKAAHAAERGAGIDALKAAHGFLTELYKISDALPDKRMLLHAGKLTSGAARNVVADQAEVCCTLRYFFKEEKEEAMRRLQEAAGKPANICGADGRIEVRAKYIPVVNDAGCVQRIERAAARAGVTCAQDKPRFTAEDFAFYVDRVPGAIFWLGVNSGENVRLHTPEFDFKEETLLGGLKIFLGLTSRA